MAIFSTAEQNMANASNRSRGQWEERAEGKRVDLLRGKGKSLGSFGLLVADATDLGPAHVNDADACVDQENASKNVSCEPRSRDRARA